MKVALVFGSTGLVGGYLVDELIANDAYSTIKIFNRRASGIEDPKVIEIIVDFNLLEQSKEHLMGDEVFICLGTTIKKAGIYKAMEKVDWHYPVSIAKLAVENGISKVAVVSSVGANHESSNNYLGIKGKMEQEILNVDFQTLAILRPSILLGNRKEFRFGESLGRVFITLFGFLLQGKMKKYRGIHGRVVARAMIRLLRDSNRKEIYESDALHKLGE